MFIDPGGDADGLMYGFFVDMVFINSAVNPPLYLYYNRQFRNELVRICRRGAVNAGTGISQFSQGHSAARRPENEASKRQGENGGNANKTETSV